MANKSTEKAASFIVHFDIEMVASSFTLNSGGKPSKTDKLDTAITYQLRFVRELLNMISLLSEFAVTSLLTPDDKLNEYEFDHIDMLESFKILTEFSSQILASVSFQSKTGVLKNE